LALRSAPEQFGHRPVFAPETAEQTVSKRGEPDKRALILLDLSGERSLHTGEVVGSIPTAPTIERTVFNTFSARLQSRSHVSIPNEARK
jgi:hypothetical protein